MTGIAPYSPPSLEVAGYAANTAAKQGLLEEYQRTVTVQTIRRQKADIALFRKYLDEGAIPSGDLLSTIEAWQGMTWGIIKGFREWMVREGYAMGSINVRLSTIKMYAGIAFASGIINEEEVQRIRAVKGFRGNEADNIDEKREKTRVGYKKAKPTPISSAHMKYLKDLLEQDSSFTGVRDYLLVCLLGYQGLRCGEVAALKTSDVNVDEGIIVFYRRKVKKTQRHEMHKATLKAMSRYLGLSESSDGLLFEGVDHKAWIDSTGKAHKAHKTGDGLSTRSINARIAVLGKLVGIGVDEGTSPLSPHDLRHHWTFDAFRHKTPIDVVMQAGGWNSYKMPLHYRGESAIANEGIIQSE